MKKFELTEEQFVLLTAHTNYLRNNFIREMDKTEFTEVKEYYQKEIDRINALFDELNLQFKTNF
jgi:hypothetical protein